MLARVLLPHSSHSNAPQRLLNPPSCVLNRHHRWKCEEDASLSANTFLESYVAGGHWAIGQARSSQCLHIISPATYPQ
jgi:hypothetical protein